MGMEISSLYGNYADSYRGVTEGKVADGATEKSTSTKQVDQTDAGRKTANDELAYLSNKHDFRGSTSDLTTTNTDEVDREIKELKEKKAHLKQELRTADASRKKELERELQQVEMELAQKDNDTYRQQNATVLSVLA